MSSHIDAHQDAHAPHGTFQSYMVGFGISIVLTVIPFYVVMSGMSLSVPLVLAIIFVFGGAQMLVHMHYFLHVNLKTDEGWQALSIVFTVIVIVIMMAGSIWVMTHLHENMMPAHEQIERVRNLP
ncbi:MAG: cytochrome o ubiquinol oxidase subunit IV [Pseudomonadota bacterium]